MACRDCKWWNRGSVWRIRYGRKDMAECLFPVPNWVHREYDGQQSDAMREDAGEGCPQFKERNDGE